MICRYIISALSVALLLSASSRAAAAVPTPPGPLTGLLVGVTDYAAYPCLAGAEPAAHAIAAALAAAGATSAHLRLMVDSQDGSPRFPTAANLRRALEAPTAGAPAIFAMVSHVVLHEGLPALTPADAEPGLAATVLPFASLCPDRRDPPSEVLALLVLSPHPPESRERLRQCLKEALLKAGQPTLVLLPLSPDVTAVAKVLAEALREGLAGAADWSGAGNGDGLVSAAELCVLAGSLVTRTMAKAAPECLSGGLDQGTFALVTADLPAEIRAVREAWADWEQKSTHADVAAEFAVLAADRRKADVLLKEGQSSAGLGHYRSLAAKGAELAARCASKTQALALQKAAQNSAERAEKGRAAQLAAADYAAGFALREAGLGQLAAGRYAEANRTLGEAVQRLDLAALAARRAVFQSDLKGLDTTDLAAFGGPSWLEVEALVATAETKATQGDPAAGLLHYEKAIASLPAVLATAADRLGALAAQFATPTEYTTALVYLTKLRHLRPDDSGARQLQRSIRCNLRFKAGEVRTDRVGITYAFIPPGQFTMGSPDTEVGRDPDEQAHPVRLTHGFFMALTEVTEEQWTTVMGAGYRPEQGTHHADAPQQVDHPKLPKSCVTWHEAVLFCTRASALNQATVRLPTEAEWEYACRAGTSSAYNTGTETIGSRDAVTFDPVVNTEGPAAAGSVDSANRWGLRDLHGNLWEWCTDWSAPYPQGAQTDPAGPAEPSDHDVTTAKRICRGGSWFDDALMARSANRWDTMPVTGNAMIGFRPVLDAAEVNE